jgi:hypothetical protein
MGITSFLKLMLQNVPSKWSQHSSESSTGFSEESSFVSPRTRTDSSLSYGMSRTDEFQMTSLVLKSLMDSLDLEIVCNNGQ